MDSLLADLRFSLRSLRKRPGFVAVVLATLILGIGANTAIFTVVRAVLLRPLPYPASEQLVRVWQVASQRSADGMGFSLPDFEDWSQRSTSLSAFGLYSEVPGSLVLQDGGRALELETGYATPGFFRTLGATPALGRLPTDEDQKESPFVVLLSDRGWRNRFGADPGIVGRSVVFNDRPFEVLGVLPPSFAYPSASIEAWTLFAIIRPDEIPLHLRPVRLLSAVGRLAKGTSLDQAREELTQIAAALALEYPETNGSIDAAKVVPLRETVVGDVRLALLVLLGAVGLLLLIACVNVANLMLARGSGRARELVVRAALGAERGRLVRLVLAESMLLSLVGGALGLAAAYASTAALGRSGLAFLPRVEEVRPDGLVVLFALGLSLLSGTLFGIWPALKGGGHSAADALRSGRGAVTAVGGRFATGRRLPRGALVAIEVALATVLLVGAGLLVRSLDRLFRVDPGFRTDHLLAVSLTIAPSLYPERAEYLEIYRDLLDSFRSLPGVRSVATIKNLPLRSAGEVQGWRVPGAPEPPPGQQTTAAFQPISTGLFDTLGVPLLAGRDFTDDERAPVLIINRRLAREAFHSEPEAAVGKRLVVAGGVEVEVVGVVGDVRSLGVGERPPATVYVPLSLMPRRVATYLIHTDGDPLLLVPRVREAVRSRDPAQALSEVTSIEQAIFDSTARPRFLTALLAAFALLAAGLAAVGIYGVVSFATARRVPELGLRKALGATGTDLVAQVLRGALRPVAVGVGVGLVAALALSRLMAGLLFEVRPFDPPTYAAVVLGVMAVGLLACLGPARVAAASDPALAIRSE